MSSQTLQAYYVAISQVAATGNTLTITEANAVDYGMRPSLPTIVRNLRLALNLYKEHNKKTYAERPLTIKQLSRSKCCTVELYTGPSKRYGRSNVRLSYPEIPTTVFSSFYLLFETGYLKGKVDFTNCSARLCEVAKEKQPTKCTLDINDNTISLSSV